MRNKSKQMIPQNYISTIKSASKNGQPVRLRENDSIDGLEIVTVDGMQHIGQPGEYAAKIPWLCGKNWALMGSL